jgi:hypothetical protein
MKKIAALLFGLFLTLALIDGVLDIGLGLAQAVRRQLAGGETDPYAALREEYLLRKLELTTRYVPGIGDVFMPGTAPGFTIGADGERLHGHVTAPETASRHVLMLGSSQAFGVFNDDDATLAAALERQMPGTVVRSFAMPGQRLPGNTMVLEQRIAAGDRIDQVLIVNGTLDLISYCLPLVSQPPRPRQQPRPLLVEIVVRLTDKTSAARPAAPADVCLTPEGQTAALNRLMADMREVLAAAQGRNLPVTLILAPAPYISGADDGTFSTDPRFRRFQTIIDPAFARLRTRLDGLDGIVDLTEDFGRGRQAMFMDFYGHLTNAGNEALATLIAEALNRQLPPDDGLSDRQKSK